MAHGKEAARDLRYGRRGGRWADDDTGTIADDVADLRNAHQRRHTDQPCDQHRIDQGKAPSCPWCHPELLDTVLDGPGGRRPTGDVEWEGLARMADAKRAAGGTLTDLEAEALDRHPAPARLAIGGYR